MKRKQGGISLIGLILVSIILIGVALVGIKVTPSIIEYFTIVKNIKVIASGIEGQGTVAEIRKAYDKKAEVDDTPSVTGADLDISKEGNQVVISFEYSKKINLAGNVSLCIDYAGNTSGKNRAIE